MADLSNRFPDRKRTSFLYIEDALDVRGEVADFLRMVAGDVTEASNGTEGVRKFNENRPDVVITDIRMPGGLNGIEVAREIHRLSADTPVIVTTAYNEIGYREELAALGVKDILIKPFLLDRLRDVVEKYLVTH